MRRYRDPMRESRVRVFCAAAAILCGAASAGAQAPAAPGAPVPAKPVPARSVPAASPPAARASAAECGAKAVAYGAEKGFRLWVTRKGVQVQENPLRPLSPERAIVLQVVVNGRLATAYGPDFDNLHRGGAPKALEEANGHSIEWEPVASGLPATLRVVSDDGRVILGPLAFQECGTAPKVAPVATKRPAADQARKGSPESAPGLRDLPGFPQGAIQ